MAKPIYAAKWPCIFKTRFLRTKVNPWVQAEWKRATGKPAPFAALQFIWRQKHCAKLNHWGSDECPFEEIDCARAYAKAVKFALDENPRDIRGWFAAHAKLAAAIRADEKPLARDRDTTLKLRTDEQIGPSNPGDAPQSPTPRRTRDGAGGPDQQLPLQRSGATSPSPDLPSPRRGPQRIGELLGAFDPRPHQGPSKNGSESTK